MKHRLQAGVRGLGLCLFLGLSGPLWAQPLITQQPTLTNSVVAAGANLTLAVAASGSGQLRYQWRLNGAPLPDATNNTYTLTDLQVAQGGTYRVAVGDADGVTFSDPVHLVVDVPVLPFTDDFEAVNPKNGNYTNQIHGMTGSGRGSNASATRQPGEPLHAGKHGTNSVWVTWSPPQSGLAIIDTLGSGFDTLLAVYTGDTLTNLTAVAGDDDLGGHFTSLVTFNVQANVVYHIAVDGRAGSKGDIALNWTLKPAHHIPTVLSLPKDQSGHPGTNVNLSVTFTSAQPVQVDWFFNGKQIRQSQETNSDSLELSDLNEGGVGDYQVHVVTADGDVIESDPVSVQIHDRKDGGEDHPEISAEHKFADLVDSLAPPADGTESPRRRGAPASAKGNPSHSRVGPAGGLASGYTGTQIFSTYGATTEAGQPSTCSVIGGASMWYAYQAPTNGLLTVDTLGSDFATVLGVYTGPGTDFASLTLVACAATNLASGTNLYSRVSLAASAGTIYYIAVDGVNGLIGTVNLNYHLAVAPSLSSIADQTVDGSNPLGPVPFTVSDPNWPATNLVLTASSTNTNLVPNSSIAFSQSDTNCGLTVTPAAGQWGTTAITVTATDPDGAWTSITFVLTVNLPPLITTQPQDQAVNPGAAASFTVVVVGSGPFGYQWLFNGAPLAGASSATLTLNSVQSAQAGSYSVVVTNVAGSVTSAPATLAVNTPPTITAQPQSQTVNPGSTVSFGVTAAGTGPLSYQWWFNGAPLAGASSATLTLNNVQSAQAGSYSVMVTNLAGSVTSTPATLTVNVPPAITAQPLDQTAVQGGTATFSVTATGSGPLSYQWRFNGMNVAGATNAALALMNLQAAQAGDYSVVVANAAGAVASSIATLTVIGLPTITAQPQSQTVNPGSTVSFGVTAAGTGPLGYQWLFNGAPLAGASSATLTLNSVQSAQAGSYSVVVTNLAGSVTSAPATLAVNAPPTITAQPQSQTVNPGSTVSFGVTAAGTGPLGYQWLFNGAPLAGASSATLTLNNVQSAQAGSYSVVVTNVAGSVTSVPATLAVNTPPTITAQPQSQTVNPGSAVSFGVTAVGTGPLGYQWLFNGAPLAGASSATLTLNSVQSAQAGSYSVVVTNVAGSVTSAPATLAVNAAPTITAQPQSQTVNPGSAVSFGVTAAGTGPLGYQWLFNGAPLAGASSATLTLNSVQSAQAGSYSVVVTNVAGSVTSAPATLAVNAAPTITAQPQSQTVNPGSAVSFGVTAAGTGPLGYQWLFNGTPLAGASSATLTLNNVQSAQAGSYSVVVTNVAGSVTSAPATLAVNTPPTIAAQPQSQTVNPGSTVSFAVTAAGTGPLGYQWLFNGAPLAGASSATLTLNSVQSA
ncbi:MAG: immunoglobulin domain-containing protein, partial [Verrucomicrobia bacterium]|nr:immunoglobulin domain-containing protein [Verrucomicrobiota bacterium]